MNSFPLRALMVLLPALAFAAAAPPALAQASAPYRDGNIWDGRDHEPVPSEVQHNEEVAGVAPSRGQQQRADDDVEQIYRQLLQAQRRHVQ
jgi:hypothetical protein